jgi:uncharacterized protein (DUF433 family)
VRIDSPAEDDTPSAEPDSRAADPSPTAAGPEASDRVARAAGYRAAVDVGYREYRNNQRVFSEIVEHYLQRIDFAPDGYAQLIRLPQYRVAEVTVDPDHAFGRPGFTRGGASIDDVTGLFRAGEPVDAVAGEFGLFRDEVEDAIRVVTRATA